MYRDRQAPWGRPSTVAASLALLLLCLSVAPTGAYPAGPAGPPRAAVAHLAAPHPGRAIDPQGTRPARAPRAVSTDMASLTCDGPRDLDVHGFAVVLSGAQAFDRVCVTGGGTIVVPNALTLRVSALYVDASSGINGDARDRECSGGAIGSMITILARQVTLEGTLSVNGGDELDINTEMDCSPRSYTNGPAAGGTVALQTLALTLTGYIAAHGGAGSSGDAPDGGLGGVVTINAPAPVPANLTHDHIDVSGGRGNNRESEGQKGEDGAPGQVLIAPLTAAQQAALPPMPPPLIRPLAEGGLSTRRVPLPAAAFARGMGCGAGDLDIGAGQSVPLQDTRRYAHVCVHDGGVLQAGPRLVLLAQTILVDARSRIEADGVIADAPGGGATGVYPSAAARPRWDRGIPPTGVPGASGTHDDGTPGPAGGPGGGSVALIARRILVAGTVSADGGAGDTGAGSGSGGGLLLRADALQLTGTLSVHGGHPGSWILPGAGLGSAGRVTILADALYAPPGGPRIIGGALLGHTLPTDPAPPAPDPAALYVPATLHSLSGPFLAYWRAHGGLPALGYPLADPFAEGGRLVQYTQRAELVATPAGTALAPLGRLLTAGRTFAPVAPFRSTPDHVYVAATGHGLAGAFLAYWRAHHGADLLGAPLSEPLVEGNDDGSRRRYLLQWFERGRLELHAEYPGAPYVQAGLLGARALERRGWLP